MAQSKQKWGWHFSCCSVVCVRWDFTLICDMLQTACGLSLWSQIIPSFQLCSECQTAALMSAHPKRQYHTAQSLTKSQPQAVCQSLIDPLILILFTQTLKEESLYDLFFSVNNAFSLYIYLSLLTHSWHISVVQCVRCHIFFYHVFGQQ